jgi:hypothetical protein
MSVIESQARFLVFCLGRAVKPNRLLFPVFLPAVKAGLRLLLPRTERASLREALPFRERLPARAFPVDLPVALTPLTWPLR